MSPEVESSSLDDGRIIFEEAREEPPLKVMHRDPVCGMDVEAAAAAVARDYEGKTYFFCAKKCRDAFDEDPKRYVG